ncbi:MAG TPA: type III pantothenate kinase, partial [Candidatus Omnitrophica bacterium]|nr:type III pantothenate kinase [Candidatus Omnitrophota bacterium]
MKDTLLVSLGNTSVTLALAGEDGAERLKKFRLKDLNSIKKYLGRLDLTRVLVASVVPKKEKTVLGLLGGVKVFKIGVDLKVPIASNYDVRSSLGLDRLINAYYIKEKIGYPAVCIDCGTAVTIDLISARGVFEGGLIIPGFNTAAQALADNTDRLRKVNFKTIPKGFYGQSTQDCIKLGITLSISSL